MYNVHIVFKKALSISSLDSQVCKAYFLKFTVPFKNGLFSPKKVGSTNYLAGVRLCR